MLASPAGPYLSPCQIQIYCNFSHKGGLRHKRKWLKITFPSQIFRRILNGTVILQNLLSAQILNIIPVWVVLNYDTSSILPDPSQETLQILKNLKKNLIKYSSRTTYIFFLPVLDRLLTHFLQLEAETQYLFFFLFSIWTRGLHVTWPSAPWLCQPWIGASSPLFPSEGMVLFLI